MRNGGPPIIGRNWLLDLKMWPLTFHHVTEDRGKKAKEPNKTAAMLAIKRDFPRVVAPGLGLFTKGELT